MGRKLARLAIRMLTALMALIGRILYRYRVEGLGHLPRHGPCLLLLNEIGFMGTIALAMSIARLVLTGRMAEPIGVTIEDTMGFSPWGGIMRLGQVITVPPGLGQSPASLWAALKALQAGQIVVMNGDGEISWDGGPPPLQAGVAWIALRSGVPVVPFVATHTAYELWPRWAERPHATGYLTVRCGRPFTLAEVPTERIDEATLARANEIIARHMHAAIYE